MNRAGDAASCVALAAEVRRGARRLRDCVADRAPLDVPDPSVTRLAGDLEALADAMTEFAVALRDPTPPRSGRPFPHTALRTALASIPLDG